MNFCRVRGSAVKPEREKMVRSYGRGRREFLRLGAALLGSSLFPGALIKGAWAQGDKKFKLGFAVALTGVFGREGPMVKDAYHLWRDVVNAQGGILVGGERYPVETIFYDDKSTPGVSARLVEKLITSDRVDLILGSYGSSQVFAASAVSEKYGFPMISGGASSDKLFERGFKYYFSTLGRATEEVKGASEVFSVARPRPKRVAVVAADILFTSLAAEGFRKYAEAKGLDVIHYELFPMSLEDYNSMLLRVKRKEPDVLLVGSHLLVSLKVMRALKEIDFAPRGIAFSYGPTVPDFVRELGPDAEGVVGASEWVPELPYHGPVFGSSRDFARLFRERYGREPDFVEAASAAAAVAQHLAIQRAGVVPPVDAEGRRRIMEELYRLDEMTFYGRVKFAADGANEAHPPLAVQIQDGKRVGVYPEDLVEGRLRYPVSPWKER